MPYPEIRRSRMRKKEIFRLSMEIVRLSGRDRAVVTEVAEVWVDLTKEVIDLREAKRRLIRIRNRLMKSRKKRGQRP